MNNNVNRQVHRKQSERDKARREISRMEFYEKLVDPQKEARSILMARFPARKKSEKTE